MKKIKLIVVGLAVGLLTAGIAGSLQAQDKGPDKVTIDACKAKRSAVEFDHAGHMEKMKGVEGFSCRTCHHTGENDKSCADCHKEPQGKLGTCADMSPTKNPYHVNCIGCHKDLAKKPELKLTAGPVKCADCHK